jgi:LysR family transcriptional activator of nhaA
MEWLNYHHLLYFWVVAREGSVAKASQQLGLAQPTISGQIHALEREVGHKLFARSGRNLVLTEVGHVAYRYAAEIFTLGRELQETLRGRMEGVPLRFQVGVTDVIPKSIVHRLLEPVMRDAAGPRVVCHDGRLDRLVADLTIQALDVVITEQTVPPTLKVRAHHHLLGETAVAVYGTSALAARHGNGFPHSLDGAPFLLPTESAMMRRDLEEWFAQHNIRPRIVGEFDDSAVLKTFAAAGEGLFVAPQVTEESMRGQYGVRSLGALQGVAERYYAITLDLKLTHPLVERLVEHARTSVFTTGPAPAT